MHCRLPDWLIQTFNGADERLKTSSTRSLTATLVWGIYGDTIAPLSGSQYWKEAGKPRSVGGILTAIVGVLSCTSPGVLLF